MQFVDYMLLKLTFATTEVQQYENVFTFDAKYNLSSAIRMTEDRLDTLSYQRLQQRLGLQQKLVKKYLEQKAEIRKYIAYLKLMSFLIPFIIGMKRKNKVPNLNRLLQPYSGRSSFYVDRVLLICEQDLVCIICLHFIRNKLLAMVFLKREMWAVSSQTGGGGVPSCSFIP